MTDGTHREHTEDYIARIADSYHACGDGRDDYQDVPGFCKRANLEEVAKHD